MFVKEIRQECTVREFDKTRGCGTIDLENGEQAFVRYSSIVGQGLRSLQRGDRVSFMLEESQRGLTAVLVQRR